MKLSILISASALFLSLTAVADVTIKQVGDGIVEDSEATFTGQDATQLRELIASKKFTSKEIGIQNISCAADICTMNFTGKYFGNVSDYNSYLNEHNPSTNSPTLSLFPKNVSLQQGQIIFSIPTDHAFYYRERDGVVKNDKKLFKLLSKNEKSLKGNGIASFEGTNFIITCQSFREAELAFEDSQCLGHGICLDRKEFKISHECRTLVKGKFIH